MKILIIGGSIGGLTAATRCRRIDDSADITLIDENSQVGSNLAALPAFVSRNIKCIETITTDTEEELANIYNITLKKNTKAISIDRNQKAVICKNLSTGKSELLLYDKLILATGSNLTPPKGLTKATNLFILKNQFDAIKIANYIEKVAPKKILIYGFNFYSLLVTHYFIKNGYQVAIVSEKDELHHFDPELKNLVIEEIKKSQVELYLENSIKKFIFADKDIDIITKVKLDNEKTIDANIVIYMSKAVPSIELAKQAGLEIKNGRIVVDKKMKTSDSFIYAIGNIALSSNFITNEEDYGELISNTMLQAKVAASDIFGIDIEYKGILENRMLVINNLFIGCTGINSTNAKKHFSSSYETLTLYTSSCERFSPCPKRIVIKLIFKKDDKKIVGSQIFGYDRSIDKFLDVIQTAIYANLTTDDLIRLNFSYSPEFSIHSSPLNVLGIVANDICNGLISTVKFEDLENNNDYFILDIRTTNEYKKAHLEGAVNIPLAELRKRLTEIPKGKFILIYCNTGKISYIAERILKSNGFTSVANIEGGLSSIKLLESF